MTTPNLLSIYSVLTARAELAARLGSQYGGDRDLYEALGWKKTLTYADYSTQYVRQDMAKAVIDRPVKATWKNGFTIFESGDVEDTALEKGFRELSKRLSLPVKFSRLDRLTGIGKYGVLLLGLSDARTTDDWQKPVTGIRHELMYVKPYGEGSAAIQSYVTDTSSERYGQPEFYNISVDNLSSKTSTTIKVHWSRCVHVTDDPLESEIEGTPRLEAVFNCLQNLERIVGGSGEMFWRGARPGYQGKIDKEFQLTDEMKDALQDQVDEYEHHLRRLLLLEGIELDALAVQVSDPSKHVDVQIQMISAATGIPKRILTGSELGELASTEDANRWFELIESRRNDFAEPAIIIPFVNRCIEYGILPKPQQEWSVKWADLWTMGDKERAEIARIRSTALKEYSSMPLTESVVPPEAYLKVIMGLSAEEIGLIEEYKRLEMEEEESSIIEEEELAAGGA